MIFSFIVAMLETALKSTSAATPSKPGVLQDKEIHNFDDEVWSKVCTSMNDSLVVDDASSMLPRARSLLPRKRPCSLSRPGTAIPNSEFGE